MPDVLVTLGVIFFVIAIADFVTLFTKKSSPASLCIHHDWFEIVDDEDKHLNFICNTCKKTPSMINEDMHND